MPYVKMFKVRGVTDIKTVILYLDVIVSAVRLEQYVPGGDQG